MRLWSLHPKYFNRQTLVDLWRDCQRAARLIQDGKDGKYPQLERFCGSLQYICDYMYLVANIGDLRGWRKGWLFGLGCIPLPRTKVYPLPYAIPVTAGQMEFETWHYGELLVKKFGGGSAYLDFFSIMQPEPHPIFTVKNGAIEKWEYASHVGYTQCPGCGGPIYHNGAGQPPKRCQNCRPKRKKA